jgi:8-hydroxy-5-deazaflavin:NADPH oxidoreductase
VASVFAVKPERKKEREMKITTIGRGEIGGTLGRLWASAGHEVTELGHDGGDAGDADVVLLAVPGTAVSEALAGVSGLQGKVVLDATNRISSETPPPAGYDSVAEYVKETTGAGSLAKVFHLNYGAILDRAASGERRPSNLWVGDEGAREAVEQLSADIGMKAAHGGPLERAATAEAFTEILISVGQEAGAPIFYRFATPENP